MTGPLAPRKLGYFFLPRFCGSFRVVAVRPARPPTAEQQQQQQQQRREGSPYVLPIYRHRPKYSPGDKLWFHREGSEEKRKKGKFSGVYLIFTQNSISPTKYAYLREIVETGRCSPSHYPGNPGPPPPLKGGGSGPWLFVYVFGSMDGRGMRKV